MSDGGDGWLAQPKNVQKLLWALYILCALSVLADFFYEKHGHTAAENMPGFHAVYGFAAFTFIVFVGKALRRVVKRDEDYYD